jgi:hypothetical protein
MDPRIKQMQQQAFEQGRVQGQQEARINDMGLSQAQAELRNEFEAKMNRMAGGLRKQFAEQGAKVHEKLGQIQAAADSLSVGGGGGGEVGYNMRDEGNLVRPGNIRIEDIPGRRVPFVYAVDIFIENNTTSIREASLSISQEGPFVAVKRMAIFQSAYEFQTTDPVSGNLARFAGRSFGRYRPIHSAWDLLDAQSNAVTDSNGWWVQQVASAVPGGPTTPVATAALSIPSNSSSFRTMQFDGRIEIINAGSSYPRQNKEVPSAFWSCSINSPWDLGALDFFERGEVITFKVNPTHVNNPPAGNVQSDCVLPNTFNGGSGWPFLEGQYDLHEGICTPEGATLGEAGAPNRVNVVASDPVQRLPDGILTLAFEGYRIIQPIGPAA